LVGAAERATIADLLGSAVVTLGTWNGLGRFAFAREERDARGHLVDSPDAHYRGAFAAVAERPWSSGNSHAVRRGSPPGRAWINADPGLT